MTITEIKNAMLKRINACLASELEDDAILNRIDEERINDFMWNRDFGLDLIEPYIEDHMDDLIEMTLESIYESIDTEDLECPF